MLVQVAYNLGRRGVARSCGPGACALCGLSLERLDEMRPVRSQPTGRRGLLDAAPLHRPVGGQEGPGVWHTLRPCGCMVCAACLAEWLEQGEVGEGAAAGGGRSPASVILEDRRSSWAGADDEPPEDELHLAERPCPVCTCTLDGRTFTCRTQGKFVQGIEALRGWPLDYH